MTAVSSLFLFDSLLTHIYSENMKGVFPRRPPFSFASLLFYPLAPFFMSALT